MEKRTRYPTLYSDKIPKMVSTMPPTIVIDTLLYYAGLILLTVIAVLLGVVSYFLRDIKGEIYIIKELKEALSKFFDALENRLNEEKSKEIDMFDKVLGALDKLSLKFDIKPSEERRPEEQKTGDLNDQNGISGQEGSSQEQH